MCPGFHQITDSVYKRHITLLQKLLSGATPYALLYSIVLNRKKPPLWQQGQVNLISHQLHNY